LRGNQLRPVYHEDHGVRTFKELGRSYLIITKDLSRVMSPIKAVYRRWRSLHWYRRLCCPAAQRVVAKIFPARSSSAPLSSTSVLRFGGGQPQASRRETTAADSFHRSDRGALLVAVLQTPHRFRTNGQRWAYNGLPSKLTTTASTAMSVGAATQPGTDQRARVE